MSEASKTKGETDTTVAVCKCGGIIIAAVTAYIDREGRKALMDAAVNGCSLQHVTVKEVRETLPFGCSCSQMTDAPL